MRKLGATNCISAHLFERHGLRPITREVLQYYLEDKENLEDFLERGEHHPDLPGA